MRLRVDGELFEVVASAEIAGQYRFAWLSGRNQGYGFGSKSSNGSALSESAIEAAIRNFLAQVDPDTGFIE
jgi:curli biogenesis system outer membrane secretion channel CsgG